MGGGGERKREREGWGGGRRRREGMRKGRMGWERLMNKAKVRACKLVC